MLVRVLGSGAGGGVPQWNCGCPNCTSARSGDGRVEPRTQSSIAVSSDGVRWVLCNASPDVRTQLTRDGTFAPQKGALRGSPIGAVVLTNADIDHAAGLLVLREGGVPALYGTEAVRQSLTVGLSIVPALTAFGPVTWRTLQLLTPVSIADRDNRPLDLVVRAFAVASKPPPYMLAQRNTAAPSNGAVDTVGLVLSTSRGPGRVAYVPGVRDLDDDLAGHLRACDVILIDGTFYTDDEMVSLGASQKTARAMGHAPITGDGGLLSFLARFSSTRRILVHINNSNPVLDARSEAHRAIRDAGIEIANDGLAIEL